MATLFLGYIERNSHFKKKAEEDLFMFLTLFAVKPATWFCIIKMRRSFKMPERSSFLVQIGILGETLRSQLSKLNLQLKSSKLLTQAVKLFSFLISLLPMHLFLQMLFEHLI